MSSVDPHDENALAGRLIERLLVDPVFRGEFRRDPVGACVAAGLPGLAGELGGGVGSGMETLELRESRSSLAGVVMAAAVEGLSVAEAQAFVEHGAKGLRLGHGLKLPHGVRAPAGVSKVQGLEHKVVGRVHHEVRAAERLGGGSSPQAGHVGGSSGQAGSSSARAGGAVGRLVGLVRVGMLRRLRRRRRLRRPPPLMRPPLRSRRPSRTRPVALLARRAHMRPAAHRSRRRLRLLLRRRLHRRPCHRVRGRARRCRGLMRPGRGMGAPVDRSRCPVRWTPPRRPQPPARSRWPGCWSHRRCRHRRRRGHFWHPEERTREWSRCWGARSRIISSGSPASSLRARRCTCSPWRSCRWMGSRWGRTISRRVIW